MAKQVVERVWKSKVNQTNGLPKWWACAEVYEDGPDPVRVYDLEWFDTYGNASSWARKAYKAAYFKEFPNAGC